MTAPTIEDYRFFDGREFVGDPNRKRHFPLASSDFAIFKNACVYWSAPTGEELRFDLFIRDGGVRPQESWHWERSRLERLAAVCGFQVQESASGSVGAYHPAGYYLEFALQSYRSETLLLVFSVRGGRAPEGIFVYGLFRLTSMP